MTELPTGTVTFLFTDLEGSTRLWEQLPDAMRGAMARHDEILRDAVDKRGGVVVKTTGDGLHAAFARAHEAIAAAVDAQRRLAEEPWALPDPLLVRMGVHTGEADLREDLELRLSVSERTAASSAAVQTAVGKKTGALLNRQAQYRVVKGQPDQSDLYLRMGLRSSAFPPPQMPPYASEEVDPTGRAAIAAWITAL